MLRVQKWHRGDGAGLPREVMECSAFWREAGPPTMLHKMEMTLLLKSTVVKEEDVRILFAAEGNKILLYTVNMKI